MEATAVVTAVLARHTLPLSEAEALRPGQVLPLPGVTVGSVRLEAPIGRPLAAARLGNMPASGPSGSSCRARRRSPRRCPACRSARRGLRNVGDAADLAFAGEHGRSLGRSLGRNRRADRGRAGAAAEGGLAGTEGGVARGGGFAFVPPIDDDGPPDPFEGALAERQDAPVTPDQDDDPAADPAPPHVAPDAEPSRTVELDPPGGPRAAARGGGPAGRCGRQRSHCPAAGCRGGARGAGRSAAGHRRADRAVATSASHS